MTPKSILRSIRRPSPALLISLLALFVALGGVGYATTTKSPGPSAQTAKHKSKTKRGPRGKRGKRGPRGFKGDTGATGGTGARGATGIRGLTGGTGSPSGSYMGGRVTGFPGNGESWFTPTGSTTADWSSEPNVEILSPARAISARDLSIREVGLASSSRTYTLSVNGTDFPLTCTITTSDRCSDPTHVVTIPANSTVSFHVLRVCGGGSCGTGKVLFGWRATTP